MVHVTEANCDRRPADHPIVDRLELLRPESPADSSLKPKVAGTCRRRAAVAVEANIGVVFADPARQ